MPGTSARFATTNPSYSPYRSRVSARPTGSSATTTSSSANPVIGQCRWRPEGRRDLRRPLPPQDQRLEEPDFLASILGSIDAMAPTGNGSSASTPADGLCLSSTSLSLCLSLVLGLE